ncbi:MAG: hypothetical protein JRI25_08135 [Deltaproteobacteria bacterium]|nr:hypothetical protein [Deltaproteobacteria bacterium]
MRQVPSPPVEVDAEVELKARACARLIHADEATVEFVLAELDRLEALRA